MAVHAFVIYPPHPFCDSVDAAWRDGDYDRIKMLIEDRLSKNDDDPMALSMGCHYEAFIGHDTDKFVEYVQRLKSLGDKFNKSDLFEGEMGKMYDTSESALAELRNPLPDEAREEIARAFPKEFPGSLMSYMMAKYFIDDIPRVQEEFRGIYETFLTKTKEILISSSEQLRSDASDLVISQRPAEEDSNDMFAWNYGVVIDEKFWTSSISALRPKVVYWTKHGISIAFFKFMGKSEGVFVYANDNDPSELGHIKENSKEMITNGIFWYSYNH